jgi:Protein of unknown function (DUF3071)
VRTLRLVALSDDGSCLVLAAEGDPDGERFELPIDERVRAAARGDARRLGQIDVDLGNSLPPRVIQARIRAGETPEQVAAASGTRVERIMRFAHPVLQERARVAEQAQEARVRLSDGTGVVTLQRFMAERLRLIGTDTAVLDWDAHRADDGTWLVDCAWRSGEKSGTTRWVFDIPARTVTPADAGTADFAEGTRLVRVVPDVPGGVPGAPAPRGRAVVSLPQQDSGPVPDPRPEPTAADVPGSAPDGDGATMDTEALLDEIAEHDTVVLGRGEDAPGEDEDPRARIPAWEDIVFGVRRHR